MKWVYICKPVGKALNVEKARYMFMGATETR